MAKDKQLIEERPEDNHRLKRNLRQTADGREIPNSTPMEPPIGYKKQPSIFDQVRAMVRSDKLKQEAINAGMETFEEADDFDLDEDEDPHSKYENEFDPIPETDRRALRGELPSLDDPELQRLSGANERRPPLDPQPSEGGAGGSQNRLPDPPGRMQRVREYVRRKPGDPEDPGERQ